MTRRCSQPGELVLADLDERFPLGEAGEDFLDDFVPEQFGAARVREPGCGGRRVRAREPGCACGAVRVRVRVREPGCAWETAGARRSDGFNCPRIAQQADLSVPRHSALKALWAPF